MAQWWIVFVGTLALGPGKLLVVINYRHTVNARFYSEIGVGIAVGVSLIQVIYRTARPNFVQVGRLPGTLVYKVLKCSLPQHRVKSRIITF